MLLTISGCAEYIEALPYMQGTFVGFYLTDEGATPVGVRIETEVVTVSETRYTFSGTGALGTQTYTVEGYEEADPNLTYRDLSPQVYIPSGHLVMNFTDADGAFAYALCAYVRYDLEPPYTLVAAALYKEPCEPYGYSGQHFAGVHIERFAHLAR